MGADRPDVLVHLNLFKKCSFICLGENEAEACSPGTFVKSSGEYVKTNESVNLKLCVGEDDGNICKLKFGDDFYCFKHKANATV